MKATFMVLLQLSAWALVVADEPAPAVDATAATMTATSDVTANQRLLIRVLLDGCPDRDV
jgi:hypothetical protein